MAIFKKKLEIGAAMRFALGKSFSRDLDHVLSDIRSGKILTDDELSQLQREVRSLETALWYFRFAKVAVDQRVSIDTTELIELFMLALVMALRDEGIADADLEATADRLWSDLEAYAEAFNADAGGGTDPRERFFLACQQFPQRILPAANVLDPAYLQKRLQIFHVAKEIDERQDIFLSHLLQNHRLVNT